MHIDPIEIDYHSVVYSGCRHSLAYMHDKIPMVQRLFRMGMIDYGIQRFSVLSLFPFKHISGIDNPMPMFSLQFQLLTINHELDYYSFHSLN